MAYLSDFKLFLIVILSISLNSSLAQQEHSTNSLLLCNENNCPFGQGDCINNQCHCFIGYITYNNHENHIRSERKNQEKTEIYCNYEAKSHTIAFFLEFFFPFGTGHFYSQRYIHGCLKLILFLLLCIFWCGDICGIRIRFALNSKMDKIHILIVLLNLVSLFILHVIDLVCFGFQIYKDGNGVDMI